MLHDNRCEEILKSELKKRVETYRVGLDKNETTSCMLALADIQFLIDKYKKSKIPIDGFRIYFIREHPTESNSAKSILKLGEKGQMSIVLVPTNQYSPPSNGNSFASAQDMFDDDGKCFVLSPGGNEHTGLCPTNCGGSL